MLTPIEEIEGCDAAKFNVTSPICLAGNGIEILKSLGFTPSYYWVNVAILAVMMLFIRALALAFFIIRVRKG
ncbi:hypothetical protein OESDEN_08505 [Oesophagostomum dentatum]|uniref:CDR ABC transporter domain-containing protein n=1 Tax=Oesophagostomum dentatum TaxID=61180 RepID=A0A0B1T299_OESDE|nr:hypothetical protein OESDEN_21405 [Oesophagostomum dentatum]KHJ91628.1 hypothetical protein OESDEN_08505 [Oesophagostomum dentatum]